MKKLQSFDEFLNESLNEGFEVGNNVRHKIYWDIEGKIIAGPMKFKELVKSVKGVDMPDEDSSFVKSSINKPVWIAIELNKEDVILGANMIEFSLYNMSY